MRNIHHKIFVIILLVCLYFPLLRVIGIRIDVPSCGVEEITENPKIDIKDIYSGNYQRTFEKYWNTHFGSRNILLIAKNQVYDWVNFGKYHTGFFKAIIQGKEKMLFEEFMMPSAFACINYDEEIYKEMVRLKQFSKEVNIPVYIVLAPNKSNIYPEYWPNRYKYFYRDNCDNYKVLEDTIQKAGIPVYNANTLAKQIKKEKNSMFVKTGIHWTIYGAGLALKESMKKFGIADIEIKDIEYSKKPYYSERDLADLLNLYVKYKIKGDKYPNPVLESKNFPKEKTITVIGSSFGQEYRINLEKFTKNIIFYENPPINEEDAKKILKNSDMLILVYENNSIMYPQYGQIYKKLGIIYKTSGVKFNE